MKRELIVSTLGILTLLCLPLDRQSVADGSVPLGERICATEARYPGKCDFYEQFGSTIAFCSVAGAKDRTPKKDFYRCTSGAVQCTPFQDRDGGCTTRYNYLVRKCVQEQDGIGRQVCDQAVKCQQNSSPQLAQYCIQNVSCQEYSLYCITPDAGCERTDEGSVCTVGPGSSIE